MDWNWISFLAGMTALAFIGVIVVIFYDSGRRKNAWSFFSRIWKKTKRWSKKREVWKVIGTGVGLGLLVTAVIVLGYYAWHLISSWISSPSSEPEVAAVAAKWYHHPIVWVGAVLVGVLCLLLALVFLQKRLKPGYAEVKVAEMEKKTDKDKDDKKDDKDAKKDPAAKKKEGEKEEDRFSHAKTWYGQTLIYTVMVIGFYLLATWLTLSYLRPKLWEWLWDKNEMIFWFIPGTILATVLAIKFKHLVVVGFALFMIGILSWSIMDASGASDWLQKWYGSDGRVELKKIETAKPPVVWGKGGWHKPFGIAGRNPEVREANFNVKVVKNDDDMMEFYVLYTHESVDYEAHYIWDKKNEKLGTWDQPTPCERGEWTLTETEPGSGKYKGKYTDGSLKGEWIELWLELPTK